MATDELDEPLGRQARRKGLKLPFAVSQIVAGALGICVAVVAAWTIFVSDPFGGEPVAIVATKPGTKANAGDQGIAAAVRREAPSADGIKADAAPPGSKTINIIDGSSGKSQQVIIPGKPGTAADGKAEKAAPDQRLLEKSRHGEIPKIGPDGARATLVYARPIKIPPDKASAPRIAIIVGGLGVSAAATADAMAKLPPAVTLAFMPYGANLDALAAQARAENHEVLLQAPMEPFDYPDNDPGPQTLLTSLSADQNVDRLQWLMSRMQGYVGIASYMGARFSGAEQALSPVLRETGKRGLLYVDDASTTRSVAGQIAGSENLPFAKTDVVLDAVPTKAEIERALSRLEMIARDRGSAVGFATALPATIGQIADWAKQAATRGFVLVPITMIAVKTKSS